MSLESFYGGKPGISPVIKKSFKYISSNYTLIDSEGNEEDLNNRKYVDPAYGAKIKQGEIPLETEVMETCFAKSDYTDVWYGELAIIDAETRNNPNHGRLYRRTLNRSGTNDPNTPHAEYIGTLAGPAGGFPQTKIVEFNKFKDKVDEEGVSYIYPSPSGIVEKTYNDFFEDIQEQTWNVPADLVPGKYEEDGGEKFNDKIKYYWVNVVNENQGEEKNTLYLGFQIPYPVFDFNIRSIDWTKDFSTKEDEESQSHPFYKKTQLFIPIGVKGNSVGNFRKETITTIVENSNDLVVYQYNDFYFNEQGLLSINEKDNPIDSNGNEITPINNISNYQNKQVWVYDFRAYGRFQDNTTYKEFTCYLGKIEEIENIQVTEEGIIQVKYLNKEAIPINSDNPIKYIKNTKYNSNNGEMTINYNIGEPDTFNIPGIKSISIDDNGWVFYKTTSNIDTKLDQPLSFVKGITIDDYTKEVSIVKTTGTESTETYLKSIENITLDGWTGDLTIRYNTKKEDGNPVTETIKNFRLPVESAEIAAGLYTGLLRAIAVFQEKYYDSQYINEDLLNKIKKIETESPSISIVEAIIRGDWNNPEENNYQSFWLLQKKYFNNQDDFEHLKENGLNLKYKTVWNESGDSIEEEYFDFYPYDEGKIRFFRTADISSWDDLESENEQTRLGIALNILKLENVEGPDRTGQLLYYKSNAFYYDHNMRQWKHAGTWSSTADKSHIQILQYDVNGEPESINTNFQLSKAGFYFEQRNILSNKDEKDSILLKEFSNEN